MTIPSHELKVADVFRAGFEEYLNSGVFISREQYQVANAIMDCRTERLGGRLYKCEHCNHQFALFNSCRNRHCPQCQAMARAEWARKRTGELLPVQYFHVVFTIPDLLKSIALRNKRIFYNLMFRAVSEALNELAQNPKRLGGQIGFIAILHTWTQTLMDHPHIHCIVPAGALSPDGVEWIGCQKDFLFPVDVVKALYRGKFLAYFREAVATGDMVLSGDLVDQATYANLIDTLYKTAWCVYMEPSISTPENVIKYLSAYTNRIAISDKRIKAVENGNVSFSYLDRRDNNTEKLLTLSQTEFIRRFLLHVLPKGFVRIRHYGFLANKDRTEHLEQCRRAIQGYEGVEILFSQTAGKTERDQILILSTPVCPQCKERNLFLVGEIPKRRVFSIAA